MSTARSSDRIAILQGTLELLILRTLPPGPAHGHAIAKAIDRGSEDILQVEQESLHPAFHRLLKRDLIPFEEGTFENGRRAKFYRLTLKGRKQLAVESSRWTRFSQAIARILTPASQE